MRDDEKRLILTIRLCLSIISITIVFLVVMTLPLFNPSLLNVDFKRLIAFDSTTNEFQWTPPDYTVIPATREGDLIRHGMELVTHTANYFGPGAATPISNGMNCQNCHLQGGNKPFGNNFFAVASTYPKFRERSGTVESIEKRVNDCIERSLNGKAVPDESWEMQAMVAYIKWVGKDVPAGVHPVGSGILTLPFLQRAADSVRGKMVYEGQCANCHGHTGEGMKLETSVEWKYPPLWGDSSYSTGAGMFRLSRLAGYVKMNMPEEVSPDKTGLTDEEAWDVAAYINSMPRPRKLFSSDWPDSATKPVDHPFGPYADHFSEAQHKYGPFLPIQEFYKGR